ncbi:MULTISPECIES: alanyl-tRNA editing protein [unclassified Paludibacterium]|uniref:alanyl-tRNA editing protein n=1 Tax=unclassified Paludibacterium TaxID=2618429 RepID=UPI001C05E657|nr:alanyl-tRNA editing protein [Paludibacterium sp. B53371]BEV73442.1 alanyl-tRNA editing protein [Paludibacterium sp. THUN1379]
MQECFYLDPYQTELQTTVLHHRPGGVVLADTISYPQGGGQPGDTGTLTLQDGSVIAVENTRRDPDSGEIVHFLPETAQYPASGSPVTLRIDWARRHRHMRMHTCLHLLSEVLKYEVTSGNLTAESARLDFNLPEGEELNKDDIETRLNQMIAADHAVTMKMIPAAELIRQPDLIASMALPPPLDKPEVHLVEISGVSLEPCGGTHVRHTAEIGPVLVKKIENKGKRNKRVVIAFADA